MSPSTPTPGLVDRARLLQWASTVGAKHQLPRVIRKLVLETGVGVSTVDFPAGEGVSTGGVPSLYRVASSLGRRLRYLPAEHTVVVGVMTSPFALFATLGLGLLLTASLQQVEHLGYGLIIPLRSVLLAVC
jgi:hypothetical protein